MTRSTSTLAALALAALALASCGLAPGPGPEAPFPGDGVAGFGDSAPVELCLGTARVVSPDVAGGDLSVCVPAGTAPPACSDDGACEGIETCVCGRCLVTACSGGAACAAGQVCSGQRCTTACSTDGDCAAGETCSSGGCTRACGSDAECHHGETCDALFNVCETKLCSDAMPCAPGAACQAEAAAGSLHEPELATVAGAAVAYVELRDGSAGAAPAIYRATVDGPGRWTADPAAPVLAALPATPTVGAGAPSVLVSGDQVEMFFALGDGQAIAHAVSTDGGRTFTPDAAPVLVPAEPWENGWVGSPAAVRFQGQTLLFYEGGPRAGVGMARLGPGGATRVAAPVVTPASATDPFFWRDVTQVGAPYAVVGGVVGGPSGSVLRVYFTGRGVEGSDALVSGASVPADPNDSIGLVATLDAVTFAPYPAGPVLARVTNLRAYLGEREAAVTLAPGGGAQITFVSTDASGTSESGLAQAEE